MSRDCTRTASAGGLALALAFAVGLCTATPAFGVGTWQLLGSFPGSVSSVQAIDYQTVFVGGSYTPSNPGPTTFPGGRIYRSIDGGTGFQTASMTTCFAISGLSFIDGTRGWATGIGFDAQSYSTVDGGTTWTSMGAFAKKATKKAITFADANNGWAVGQQGVIERTRDGGRTWEVQVEPVSGPDLLSVDFVDAQYGWAAGGAISSGVGFIRATKDGGATWTTQRSGLPNALRSIAFADRLHGVAAGENGTLLVTSDGGATWTQATIPRKSAYDSTFSRHLTGVGWADGMRVFAAGYGGTLLASPDQGNTWTHESDPTVTSDFTAMGAAGGSRIWLTAGTKLYRYTYTPPPTKWTKRTSGSTGVLYAVDFVDTSYGWAVGYGGTILKTTDGAKSWKRVGQGITEATLTGVDFVDRNNGWVIGRFAISTPLQPTVILRTSDGGATWVPQAHPNDGTYIWRVRMRSATDGWILGENWRIGQAVPPKPYFSILRTTNGGTAWVPHGDAPADLMTDATFPSANRGYAVGYRGNDFKTTDGGQTWTKMPGLSGIGRAMGVAFTNADNGIIAGDRVADSTSPGAVAHTTDGGSTWSTAALPSASQLRCATSAGTSIWVVGVNGTILRSGDGGASWGLQSVATSQSLWGVCALSTDFVVAVGDGGTILTGARPGVTLSKPALGFAAKKNSFLQITGTVKPDIPFSKTKVVVYRKVGSAWRVHKTVTADNFTYSSSSGTRYSKYYANTKAGAAGTYSAIATFSHPDYKTTKSARFTFTVK